MDALTIGWEAWFTLAVIGIIIVALLRDLARPELVLLGALGLLLVAGVLEPQIAFAGFASPAVFTIGALYVVAAGVQRTEALRFMDHMILSDSGKLLATMPRLMGVTALLSAFLNNTPIVAMLVPRIQQWSARTRVPASLLLIPLSYAAIIGGMSTLIGTSTNIVVSELLANSDRPGLGMFTLSWVGIPVTLVVLVYFVSLGYRLLPNRKKHVEIFEDGLRDCLFELKVGANSPLSGKTIEESGLRSLGGAYLAHVQRRDRLMPAFPDETLLAGDKLTFTGTVTALQDLHQMNGLERAVVPLSDDEFATLPLYEAVVAKTSELVGKTLKEVGFREKYNGVVLGIQRQNKSIKGRLGQTPLEAGDLLLIEAPTGFDKRWNEKRNEFYLVAPRTPEKEKPLTRRAPVALVILALMVVAFATSAIPLVTAAFVAALAMIVTRCIRGRDARMVINFSVLAVIGAALGIGKAVEVSGLADMVATSISMLAAGLSPLAVIAVIYIATNLLTELITNQAAAILMLPIGMQVADSMGVNLEAIAVVVAVAASASFMTPFGYQTNLMVMAAGGYRFKDYLKVGMPVSLLVMITTIVMVYLVWIRQ